MPLRVTRRADRGGALTIVGTVNGQEFRRRAASNDPKLAAEEAAVLEAQLLRAAWHGERPGNRTFAEAVKSYLDFSPRSESTKAHLRRILMAVGPQARLADMTQERLDMLRVELCPDAVSDTFRRSIIVPVRAVMRHAHRRGWCDAPLFDVPPAPPGRTVFMTPLEAERLILAAAPHLKPLIEFLLCTGARMSETLGLEWKDVDLNGARAIFWPDQTKSGKRRIVNLPPRITVRLAEMPKMAGRVFRKADGTPYETSRERGDRGGQIKKWWSSARKRAGLSEEVTPHTCRHTWASWHYALHRDVLALKQEGGWGSRGAFNMVERYAHLLPSGHEEAIRAFWDQGGEPVVVMTSGAA